jgi:hypothetical protein
MMMMMMMMMAQPLDYCQWNLSLPESLLVIQ